MNTIINKIQKIKQFKVCKVFCEIFSLDPRSLALFRIALGLLILTDLYVRSRYLEAHYTDQGSMPRWVLLEHFFANSIFSFHLTNGSFFFISVMFIINAFFALMLILGWKTQKTTAICWLFLMSLQNRHTQILQGGDVLFRMVVLWGVFLPLGRFWSIDSRKQNSDKGAEFSSATFAYTMQIFILYTCAAIHKVADAWMKHLDGVYLALNADHFATGFAQTMLQYPELNKFLSLFTLYCEAALPFALICPFFFQYTRLIAILMLICMHVGFASGLSVGLFWIIDIVSLIALIPNIFWQHLETSSFYELIGRLREKLFDLILNVKDSLIELVNSIYIKKLKLILVEVFVLFSIFYIMFWVAPNYSIKNVSVSPELHWFGKLFGMDQSWQMFSPVPMTDDGWWVIVGKLKDSTEVDVLERKVGPVSFDKPKLLYKTMVTDRWRKYFRNLLVYKEKHAMMAFAKGICGNWNRQEESEEKKLDSFEIYYMMEKTLPHYQKPNVEKMLRWKHYCFKVPDENKKENEEK